MGAQYLIDSNAVIDYLVGKLPPSGMTFMDEVVEQTIDFRKVHKIKLPDAIIAATAIINKFDLITRNTTDFKGIPGLSVIDPYTV